MNILVFYASIEGQTQKIAETISRQLEEAGHDVFLTAARQVGFVGAGTHDAAIMCAPIHMHKYPTPFVHFVQEWKDALNAKPSAFVSVSLAIASKDPGDHEEAMRIAEEMVVTSGWTPRSIAHCAGALKYTEYDFFKRWVMKKIAGKEGGPVDTSQDYELTDWPQLKAFVEKFLADAQKEMKAA